MTKFLNFYFFIYWGLVDLQAP